VLAPPSITQVLPCCRRIAAARRAVRGRLDQDSTGLLLFSDDGQFIIA